MDDGIPPFLTVPEAGRLLRIGRTKAYDLTKEWRATGGRSGLPVVDLGDVLVPGPAVRQMLGLGLTDDTAGPEPAADPEPAKGGALPTAPRSGESTSAAMNDVRPPEPPFPVPRPRRPRRQPAGQLPLFDPRPNPESTTSPHPDTPDPEVPTPKNPTP